MRAFLIKVATAIRSLIYGVAVPFRVARFTVVRLCV
jgi:hypothetical protein